MLILYVTFLISSIIAVVQFEKWSNLAKGKWFAEKKACQF